MIIWTHSLHRNVEKSLLSLSIEGPQIDVMLSCMALEVNNVFLEFVSACMSSYALPRHAVSHKEPTSHKNVLKEYQIRCTAEKCLLSVGIHLPAIQEVPPILLSHLQILSLTVSTHFQLVLTDSVLTAASGQFFNLSLLLSQLSTSHKASFSIFESEFSIMLAFSQDATGVRTLTASTSVEKVDLLSLPEKNSTNSVVVNCNSIEPLLQMLNQFLLVVGSLPFVQKKAGRKAAESKGQLTVNVDFPAVILKYAVFNSVYLLANVQSVDLSLTQLQHHVTPFPPLDA